MPALAKVFAARGARLAGAAALAATLVAPRLARADETTSTRAAIAARDLDRSHTMVELGLGLLTLPRADVCWRSSCTLGDTTPTIDVWQLYRYDRDFAVGAGLTLALKPDTDTLSADASGSERKHSRSYFLVEAQGRHYVMHRDWMEAWIALTVGGVVVSDRYAVEGEVASTAPQLGPHASTLRTEGLTAGLLGGLGWSFAPNWSVGAQARYARWFLPESPATTAFGDTATLTGQVTMFEVGVAFAYRIAL